jgi:hypothetical protein
MLIQVLNSIKWDANVTPDQIALVAEYRTRVDSFDPRKPENRIAEDEPAADRPKPPKPAPKLLEGYDPSFLNVAEAIERVVGQYTVKPYYSDFENDRLLEVFLGGRPLNDYAVVQCWLALAYEFKNRGGSFDKPFASLFPPQADWVQTALASFINRNHVNVPAPNCLTFMEDVAFRS